MTQAESGPMDLSGACIGAVAADIDPTLVSWIGDQIADSQILAWLGLDALARPAVDVWQWYHRQAQEFGERQRRYWRDIIDEKIVMDYGIVDGGGPRPQSPFLELPYDQVYDKSSPLPGLHALFRTVHPIVGAGLARSVARNVQELARLAFPRRGGTPTRERVEELFIKAGIKLSFSRHLSTEDRPLLVTLGGIVSNKFVEQFLLNLPRKYHTVAYLPEKEDWLALDTCEKLESVRQQCRQWKGGGPQLLEKNIRWEIWPSKKITNGNVELADEPVIRPHQRTDEQCIYDGVHVVVAQINQPSRTMMAAVGRTRPWVFAAQSLHSLGTICTDFFFRPEELLKDQAARFAADARRAISESQRRRSPDGGGFEAVLQVKRMRSQSDYSPMNFAGLPLLECGTEVSVIRGPVPLG